MVNFTTATLALLLCLVHLPDISSALFKYKKVSRAKVSKRTRFNNDLYFKGDGFPEMTIGTKHGSLVLECQSGGPTPTMHWLKNGVRLQQGAGHNIRDDEASYENHPASTEERLRLSTTDTKLYLDCLSDSDTALYTCVAETPFARITQSTKVQVVKPDFDIFSEMDNCIGKKSGKAEPARIYMWSSARLEYENNRVQLFCRAQGYPAPTITWYDANNKPIQDDDSYKLARNGDLVISNISWLNHMGQYTCEADNGFGTNSVRTFLYPTRNDRQ